MIQQTMAEELHFIHQHIEQIDVRIDGINEELKALAIAMQALVRATDQLLETIEAEVRADG